MSLTCSLPIPLLFLPFFPFPDTWKPSIIPRAFVKLGQYLKRPLSSTEIEKFRSALLGYTRFLAKNPEDWHPIFEQIAFDHLDYLSNFFFLFFFSFPLLFIYLPLFSETHSVDPFNHMIGAIPSSFFVEKYLSEPLGERWWKFDVFAWVLISFPHRIL